MKKNMLSLILLALVCIMPAYAQTTYKLGTNYGGLTFICNAASRYVITFPSQFNCQQVPLLDSTGTKVGSVQISNAGNWVQVHAPGIVEPNQYLLSVLKADTSQFSVPGPTGPGKVVFDFQITDTTGAVFHGVISAPWNDKLLCGGRGCQFYAPQLLTTPVDGTLTIEAGPLP